MIEARNLSKTYYQGKSKIEAVKNVNLVISKKDAVLITGPSGAGKSTLLHLIGGFDKPTNGLFLLDGTDFYSMRDKERSKARNEKIGFVFQFYHLLPEFTVLENAMLPALMRRKAVFRKKNDIKERATYLLKEVGLEKRAGHVPGELSGGESQRAAIARALINFPEILLCDEPTGNLDSKIGEEVIECIWELREKENMTLVIVTHNERIHDGFDKKFRMIDGVLEEISYDGRRTKDEGRNDSANIHKAGHPSSITHRPS